MSELSRRGFIGLGAGAVALAAAPYVSFSDRKVCVGIARFRAFHRPPLWLRMQWGYGLPLELMGDGVLADGAMTTRPPA